MQFGIDAISFYTSKYYLDLAAFAKARGMELAKLKELGQVKMAMPALGEDVITLAANSVDQLLAERDTARIALVIFATESGVDQAKSAAAYIHRWFELSSQCRIIELKQACYSATCGLQLALTWLKANPTQQVLLVAADVARYAENSAAEISQGCGAVALLLSANPSLLVISGDAGVCTREVMDFWRPNYLDYALVDGRLSCDNYIRSAIESFQQYSRISGRKFEEHDRFCYHMPFAKLVQRTHRHLAKTNGVEGQKSLSPDWLEESLIYGKEIGNCYTASLYLGILSLLENSSEELSGKLLGLYSYGSGSTAEFLSAQVVPGYKDYLPTTKLGDLLTRRISLSFDDYLKLHAGSGLSSGEVMIDPAAAWQTGKFRLIGIKQHQRIYERSR